MERNESENLYYWVYFDGLGEIGIKKQDYDNGLTIYCEALQVFTDEQLRKFANENGDGFFERYEFTREDGLAFLADYICAYIQDGDLEPEK